MDCLGRHFTDARHVISVENCVMQLARMLWASDSPNGYPYKFYQICQQICRFGEPQNDKSSATLFCFFVAKFGSVAVVEALLDLLDDQEHDVRASACISLAKSKAGDLRMKIDRLMKCLRDTDRFVRESACIALGYLKADDAVPALLQIW